MAPILTVHELTVGTEKYYFRANPKTYAGIEANTGVKQPPTPGAFDKQILYSAAELANASDVETATLYFKVGGKPRRAIVFCRGGLFQAFLAQDSSLLYQGDPNTKVREARRAKKFT